ncbi:hypothetical protein [Paenibacillus sp. Leaf72]|uniref:hypothetical protein n=1 Tax=Paenibacillus sp. Leaf72 TaxID=1736234 RepID=UPI0006F86103|nr:hypothetical protein [Paenibacillus sp. Leaf72]KQN96922.1 hypothetical protein ASF12_22905 [Paenibacillus sp. Leaf72]
MKAGQWMFNHQSDGIWNTGGYHDTKAAAIAEGKSYYQPEEYKTLYVGQIEPYSTSIVIDPERVLDDIRETVSDECGEPAADFLSYVKPEHEKILSERIEKVVNEWMQEFNYEPSFFRMVKVEPFKNE